MKATHQFVKSGVKNCTISVKFIITGDDIIKAVSHMLYMGKKVNAKSLRQQFESLFWMNGTNWIEGDGYEYPEYKEKATTIAHKLFPSFFNL